MTVEAYLAAIGKAADELGVQIKSIDLGEVVVICGLYEVAIQPLGRALMIDEKALRDVLRPRKP